MTGISAHHKALFRRGPGIRGSQCRAAPLPRRHSPRAHCQRTGTNRRGIERIPCRVHCQQFPRQRRRWSDRHRDLYGKEKKSAIPDGTPAVTIAAATKDDLVPGAVVFITAEKAATGRVAQQVVVGKNGVIPPM